MLKFFGITHPQEIVVEDIAAGLDVEMSVGSLSSADALLIRVGSSGTILVSDRLRGSTKRFAVAHELGHWRLHGSSSQVFYCSAADLIDYRRCASEIEANTFACELLAPRTMLDPTVFGLSRPEGALVALTAAFGIPPLLAAIRFAQLTAGPAIAVVSSSGIVKWCVESAAVFGMHPPPKLRRCISRAARSCRTHAGDIRPGVLHRVQWKEWFYVPPGNRQPEVYEITNFSDTPGEMVSLLWFPGVCRASGLNLQVALAPMC